MKAYFAVTRLAYSEWKTLDERFQLCVQRSCASGTGMASHLSIYFVDVSPDLLNRQDTHALPSARGQTSVFFDVTQKRPASFSTLNGYGSWYQLWKNPRIHLYELNIDARALHEAAVAYADNPPAYDDNFKYLSALCPRFPCILGCDPDKTNCVGGNLMVLAAAIDPVASGSKAATLDVLGLGLPFPESYLPSRALVALKEKGWVGEHVTTLTPMGNSAGPAPLLLIRT